MNGQVTGSEKTTHLIDLFKHGDTLIQSWLRTLITIQSALAVAFIFLLKDLAAKLSPLPTWFTVALGLVIPALGILSALVIRDTMSREFYWQAWFRDSYNSLCDWDQAVFPSASKTRTEPDQQSPGLVLKRLRFICCLLAVVWLAFAVMGAIALASR
jgi:hypothetical protein